MKPHQAHFLAQQVTYIENNLVQTTCQQELELLKEELPFQMTS